MYLNNQNFSEMTEQERREFVRGMLKDDSVRSKAILMAGGDGGGHTIDLDGLIRTVGPQKVEDLLVEMLSHADTQSAVMTNTDVHTLMERVSKGEASPAEMQMANFILQTAKDNGEFLGPNATSLVSHMLLDVLYFMKTHEHYDITYVDVLTGIVTLMIASTCKNPKNAMARYKDTGPDHILPMIENMSEDIEKRLNDSWGGKKPPDDMLMLALLTYAEKVSACFANRQTAWTDPKEIADFFHLDHDFSDSSITVKDGSNDGEESPMGENGSNEKSGNTCTPNCYPNKGNND